MARISTVSRPSRTRLSFLIALVLLLLISLATTGFVLGWWGLGSGQARQSANLNGASVRYITENGPDAPQAVANSPLEVRVKMPLGKDGAPVFPVSAAVQLLDGAGVRAEFGGYPQEKQLLLPSFETGVWSYRGSVPTKPGAYHVRVTMQVLPADVQVKTSQPQTLDFQQPLLQVAAESGSPLTSGYVFTKDSSLWILSTDLSRQRRLTFFLGTEELADQAVWSPDGKTLAFAHTSKVASNEIPLTDIWVIAADSTGAHQVIAHDPDEALSDPAWSQDGKYLYFTAEKAAMSSSVYDASGAPLGERRIDRFDLGTGKRAQWLPSAQMPTTGGPGGDLFYLENSVTPPPADNNGAGPSVAQRLVHVQADGAPKAVLIGEKVFQMMRAPHLSPDGKWLVFAAVNAPMPASNGFDLFSWLLFAPQTAYAHGQPWDLYIMPYNDGHTNDKPTRLTRLDEDQPYPIWIDNSTIAFMGVTGMYRLNIDTTGNPVGDPAKIYEAAPHSDLTWHAP